MEISTAQITDTIRKHAKEIVRKNCLRVEEKDYTIEIKDLLSDSIITAGNPVRIIIAMHTFSEAWKHRNFYHFNRMLEDALRKVPRMIRTLSLVPISDVLRWNDEIKRFKKIHGIPSDYLPPIKYCVPKEQLLFNRKIGVIVTDLESHKKTSVWDFAHRTTFDELEVRAADKLGRIIRGELENEEED